MIYKTTIEIERYCGDIIEGPHMYWDWDPGDCWLSDSTRGRLEKVFCEVNLTEVYDDTYIIEVWFSREPLDAEIKKMDDSIRKVINIEEVEE